MKGSQFQPLMSSQKKKTVEKIFGKMHIFNKNMSYKVSYVKGMPFVKVPAGLSWHLPECVCKIVDGKFGVSVGIFINESPPRVREKIEDLERTIQCFARKVKTRVEDLLAEENFELKVEDLKLVKNGILWGKYDGFLRRNQKMKKSVTLRINHIFFSAQRVSISCNVLEIY